MSKATIGNGRRGHPTLYSQSALDGTRAYIDSCVSGYQNVIIGSTVRITGKGKKKKQKVKNEYKTVYKVKLPTLEGLAAHLHVHKDTIQEWKKVHADFSVLIEELLAKQAEALLNNGLSGEYNPTITKVLLVKHGYIEKVETDNKHKGTGSLSGLFERAAARRAAEQ